MEVWLDRFTTRERTSGTHRIGSWVYLKTGLDAVKKRKICRLCRESNPDSSVAQPIA
jgi:hypothetical protein